MTQDGKKWLGNLNFSMLSNLDGAVKSILNFNYLQNIYEFQLKFHGNIFKRVDAMLKKLMLGVHKCTFFMFFKYILPTKHSNFHIM